MYKYFNSNPNQDNIDDCVVRSISTALHKPYYEVFDDLCELVDTRGDDWDINQMGIFGEYLYANGWDCMKFQVRKRLSSICKKYLNDGDFLVQVKDHMTFVRNGDIYDTWDCSRHIGLYVWFKKENEK